MKTTIVTLFITSLALQATGQLFKVEPNKVNSSFSVFCPTLLNNQLVYCSNEAIDSKKSNYSNLFILKGDKSELLNEKFHSKYHDGPASFARNGTFICYSSNIKEDIKEHDLFIGLFFSEFIDSAWSDPVAFEHNSNTFHNAHPALSADGKMLYFSSTRPGGYGASDIYVSIKTDTGWSTPNNLGATINTELNEQFPYLHESGRLYFSTNAGITLGGMDIFSAFKKGENWSFPEALPEPINSKGDDFGIVFNTNQTKGHFSSSRKKGLDQIYDFELQTPAIPDLSDCENMVFDPVCTTFYESGPGQGEQVEHLKYIWKINNKEIGEGMEVDYCFNSPGHYPVDLFVKDLLLNDTITHAAHFNFEVSPKEMPHIEVKYTSSSKNKLILDASKTKLTNFREGHFIWKIKNDYYFGDKIIIDSALKDETVQILLEELNDSKKTTYKCYSTSPAYWLD